MYFSGSNVPLCSARALSVILVLVAGLGSAINASSQTVVGNEVRYIHASQLNLRAEPSLTSATLARLRINEAVTLRGKRGDRWCLVETTDGARKTGHVDCNYLGVQPLTLERIEMDFAAQALAVHRMARKSDLAASTLDDMESDPRAQAQPHIEQMFQLVERHFALSPSFYAYQDYEDLIRFLLRAGGSDGPAKLPLQELARSRFQQLQAMELALNQNFTSRSAPVVSGGIDTALRAIIVERGMASNNPDLARGKRREERRARIQQRAARYTLDLPPQPSFFQRGKWAVGWAGGPLIHHRRTANAEGAVYDVRFNGLSVSALADVYEMAKAQRQAIKVEFQSLTVDELAQMMPSADGGYRGARLLLRLPVWAVTPSGLVRGYVRQVSFGGDECSNSKGMATGAELVFPQPVRDKIQAVFSTNADIDPAKARIQVRKRAFLEGGGDTLTGRVDLTVDLDGDGIADLRTVVSEDHDVSSYGAAWPMLAHFDGRRLKASPYLRPVAGWYANNVYSLEANMGDAWRVLSFYNVVTCT